METRKHRFRPRYVVAPGAAIHLTLEAVAMPHADAARRLGVSDEHLAHMIGGEVPIDPEMAKRLEVVLEIPVRFWVSAQATYDELKDKLQRRASCSS